MVTWPTSTSSQRTSACRDAGFARWSDCSHVWKHRASCDGRTEVNAPFARISAFPGLTGYRAARGPAAGHANCESTRCLVSSHAVVCLLVTRRLPAMRKPLVWRDQYSAMVWPVRTVTYREDGWPLCPVCGHDEV